jgi:predicted lipoprotein
MKKIGLLFGLLVLLGCKKTATVETKNVTQEEVVLSLANNVNVVAYQQLALKSDNLYQAIVSFCANPSDQGLEDCRQLWKDTRAVWEKTEGFLYGPVANENIDPKIDTWPVDYLELDSLLKSSMTFNETTMSGLEDALKGFHPMEYLLFGKNGAKKASEVTTREKEYLTALSLNVKNLTAALTSHWDEKNPNNYYSYFTSPSSSNPYYKTQLDVYMEIVKAMVGICDEVANGKIGEPFLAKDPSMEESPFSGNSLTDFTNNLISVQYVYQGRFTSDNIGLEDFIKRNNLSLYQSINTKINTAITTLSTVKNPFSEAIINQPIQVQNAIDAINELKNELEEKLIPYIQLNVK